MKKNIIDILATTDIHKKFLALLPDEPLLLDLDEDGAFATLKKALPLEESAFYDGIWAAFYLLQLPETDIHSLLKIISTALIPGGYFFCSFYYGQGLEKKSDKYYTLYDELSFSALLTEHLDFTITKLWRRGNSETGHSGNTLYCLIEKTVIVPMQN